MATPCRAYASDGFLGGLQDLVGAREIESVEDYESEYQDAYDPQLRLDPPDPGTNTLTELDEDATTVDYVNSTLQSFNKSGYPSSVSSSGYSLLEGLQFFLGFRQSGVSNANRTQLIIPAAGIVFMWWGVRKSIKMIMSAFRKGSMNV